MDQHFDWVERTFSAQQRSTGMFVRALMVAVAEKSFHGGKIFLGRPKSTLVTLLSVFFSIRSLSKFGSGSERGEDVHAFTQKVYRH